MPHRETAHTWTLAIGGTLTNAAVIIRPGDIVRLPRNVARNRGSQLHAAGLCYGFAVGRDGSPCVVADAVGEDVPMLVRWRTWVVRSDEVVVIDSKEAWRLESRYERDGRLKERRTAQAVIHQVLRSCQIHPAGYWLP